MLKKIVRKILKVLYIKMPKFYLKLAKINEQRKIWQSKEGKRFKKDYPETKIFRYDRQKLNSQRNQDHIVYEHFFKNKKDGFFCDIGGNHPLEINNTLYFESLGWDGVSFEPLPSMGELWSKHRKAKLFPFALSNSEGNIEFAIVKDDDDPWGTISSIVSTRKVNNSYKTETINIQTKIFREVMAKEGVTHIDYLSLDVEGHELSVLQGIDFDKVRINVLTIENNTPGYEMYGGDTGARKLMLENNFILWGRILGIDDIYVHKDFLKSH